MGSNPVVYEVTVLGSYGDIQLPGFDIVNEKVVGDKTVITISSNMNELTFFNQIFKTLNSKYPAFLSRGTYIRISDRINISTEY
jgi:hypothetical protein